MRRPDRIYFKCPSCGTGVRAPFEFAGRRATCKACHAKIPVPPLPEGVAPGLFGPVASAEELDLKPLDVPPADPEPAPASLEPPARAAEPLRRAPAPRTVPGPTPRGGRGKVRVAKYD